MLTGWGTFMKDDGALPPHIDGILSKPPRIREIRAMLNHLTQNAASPLKKQTKQTPQPASRKA